jgi:hypothetical protein
MTRTVLCIPIGSSRSLLEHLDHALKVGGFHALRQELVRSNR